MQRLLSKLGVDDWFLIICGFAALFVAVLDFVQIIQITTETALRIILITIGLMLGAMVVQSARRASESEALLTSLDASLIEPINSAEFHFYVQNQIARAKRFVAETTLHQTIISQKEFHHPDDLPKTNYAGTLYKRIQKEEIPCWVIETIPTKERLEWVIFRLLVFEGMGWFIRYYESAPNATPVLNITSIDNKRFVLGSFYGSAAPGEKITDISIKNQKINQLLIDY